MRISSSMIYETGIRSINDQTVNLLHNEQMLSTGRRIVVPSDDPVAAARGLVVSEAKDVNAQFGTNQGNAKDSLSLEESQMSSMSDILTRVRELAVQGGDAALSPSDLKSIATELRARFDELLGLSNTTDSNGDFIFAGNMGGTKPFGANIDGLLAAPGNEVTYSGDSGQRNLQVSATRFLAISDAGNDIFRDIRNGNGTFVTDYFKTGSTAVPNTPNTANTGTAIIGAGSVTNPAAWSAVPDKNIKIQFYVDSTTSPNVTYYDLVNSTGTSLLTGAAAATPVFPGVPAGLRTFQPNQTIDFSGLQPGGTTNYGINAIIDGNPANGDSFTIAPSTTQSAFKTIANLVGALENKLANPTSSGSTALSNEIGQALTNIDQATDNMLRVRSAIGARLNELDSLSSVNQDVNLRYTETLSNLQDVDYAKTISDLQQNQNTLDAAQKSYMKVTQLSLFSYL